MAKHPPIPLKEITERSTNFLGAIGENFVLTELIKVQFFSCYWNSVGKAELDFLVQAGSKIVPFEVKASINRGAKSIPVYLAKYRPKQAVKIWLGNYGIAERVTLPHYFISALPSLLNQE